MAYRFMEKKKSTQEETTYIVYMIISSYFNKVICRNAYMEKRLYLRYTEMKRSTQENKESKVIAHLEKILARYETVLAKMNCEAMIRSVQDIYVLDFYTGFERIRAEVDPKGYYKVTVKCNETFNAVS